MLLVVILCQMFAKLFDLMPVCPGLCTFVQYSLTLYSPHESASNVISGEAVEDVGLDIHVIFVCSKLFAEFRPAHFVPTNERTSARRITQLMAYRASPNASLLK